jgi:hypothetical protein
LYIVAVGHHALDTSEAWRKRSCYTSSTIALNHASRIVGLADPQAERLHRSKNQEETHMQRRGGFTGVSAAGAIASVFGVLAGLGGLVHGIGETLQGNIAASGIIINSWTEGPIGTNMGGEPAMAIVPNLLLTGLLTLIVSSVIIVWAAAYIHRKNGGRVLILLSVIMLLVGGGFGPPIIGVLAGAAGLAIDAPPAWCRQLSVGVRRFLASSWPWVFSVSAVNGVFLVIGSVILVYGVGLNNPDLFTNSFYFAVLSLPVTIVTGLAYDIRNRERPITAFDNSVSF